MDKNCPTFATSNTLVTSSPRFPNVDANAIFLQQRRVHFNKTTNQTQSRSGDINKLISGKRHHDSAANETYCMLLKRRVLTPTICFHLRQRVSLNKDYFSIGESSVHFYFVLHVF